MFKRASGAGGFFLLAGFAALLIGGCATRKEIVGFQEDTRVMRTNLDSLKQQQELVLDALGQMDASVHEMRARSEYGSSTLEEKVELLAARLDDILNRMDRTLAPLEEFIRERSAEDTTGPAVIGVDYYDAAMNDLTLGNYDLAEVGFLQFLETYPESELADDARYGLAETFYARRDYEAAESEYDRVIRMDPEGEKVPAAMLKLGLCQRALGRTRDAEQTWRELVRDFPHTEEARVAGQRLKEIGEPR